MFGAVSRGLQAPVGHKLLGRIKVDGPEELALVVRLGLNQESDEICLVVRESGEAFIGLENYLRNDFWDVEANTEIEVDPRAFELKSGPAGPKEIAFDTKAASWIVGIKVKGGTRLVHMNTGKPVLDSGARLAFTGWRLIHRPTPERSVTLFNVA